jgi:hypothetical protein
MAMRAVYACSNVALCARNLILIEVDVLCEH